MEQTEQRSFEADVTKLLHIMVHSVYSDKDVFLRELISNAADACEKLRYEAIAAPALLGSDPESRITLTIDADNRRLTLEDNGIGMSRDEMIEGLGMIARSGTRAFMERIGVGQGAQGGAGGEGATLIGQFGVGFYATFMVAERVDVVSRRAGTEEACLWSSHGSGTFSVSPAGLADAPVRGTRVILHLTEDAKIYTERFRLERLVKMQSGHVPVPIAIASKPGAEPTEVADGAALWTKPKADISTSNYTDFYRGIAGQFDEPALTVHVRAEGRHEYSVLAFVPGTRPFDLFDPGRKGRIKLYVRRVFITDQAEILPRYLRFVCGLVDSADLPLNLSREVIQESAIFAAVKKGVTNRILGELEKFADNGLESYVKVWEAFGSVLKEGLFEDFERTNALLTLARFKTTASGGRWRSLKDYVAARRENQTAIYYLVGDDLTRLEASPHLEGFRARGVEVLLLTDPVDNLWVTGAPSFEGSPFKSASQGAADLVLIPHVNAADETSVETEVTVIDLLTFAKATLGEAVFDVRASDRLTNSAVCLVAPESGMDRQLEKLLASAGKLTSAAKPILEINPRHPLVVALARLEEPQRAFKEDAIRLLFDQARVLDGARPVDARSFSDRLGRVLERSMRED